MINEELQLVRFHRAITVIVRHCELFNEEVNYHGSAVYCTIYRVLIMNVSSQGVLFLPWRSPQLEVTDS